MFKSVMCVESVIWGTVPYKKEISKKICLKKLFTVKNQSSVTPSVTPLPTHPLPSLHFKKKILCVFTLQLQKRFPECMYMEIIVYSLSWLM